MLLLWNGCGEDIPLFCFQWNVHNISFFRLNSLTRKSSLNSLSQVHSVICFLDKWRDFCLHVNAETLILVVFHSCPLILIGKFVLRVSKTDMTFSNISLQTLYVQFALRNLLQGLLRPINSGNFCTPTRPAQRFFPKYCFPPGHFSPWLTVHNMKYTYFKDALFDILIPLCFWCLFTADKN